MTPRHCRVAPSQFGPHGTGAKEALVPSHPWTTSTPVQGPPRPDIVPGMLAQGLNAPHHVSRPDI